MHRELSMALLETESTFAVSCVVSSILLSVLAGSRIIFLFLRVERV